MVRDNPFNVIGLPAGPSEKDLARRRSMVKAYLAAGKELSFPEDIPLAASGLVRDQAAMDKSFAAIEQYPKRALHGLFWFMDAGRVDGPALNNLRAGDVNKAESIWGRVVEAGGLTEGTLSSALNLGALELLKGERAGEYAQKEFLDALQNYSVAFTHDAFPQMVEKISDPSVAKDVSRLLRQWAEHFFNGLPSSARMDATFLRKVGAILGAFPDELRRTMAAPLTGAFTKAIEREVSACAAKREKDPRGALEPAWILNLEVPGQLKALGALVGTDHMEYQHLADQVAEELLDCAIDHFNQNDGAGKVDWERLRKLMKAVEGIAQGKRLLGRIKENARTLEENYKSREERARLGKVKVDLEAIQRALQRADTSASQSMFYKPVLSREFDIGGIDRAEELLTEVSGRIDRVKESLGEKDELYLNISTAIVNKALNATVETVNNAQKLFGGGLGRLGIEELGQLIGRSLRIIARLDNMDMKAQMRGHLIKNSHALNDIQRSLRKASNSSGGSGCMVTALAVGVVLAVVSMLLT